MKPLIEGVKSTSIFMLTPCDNCPFRKDVHPFIEVATVKRILADAQRGVTFVCHKTVNYENPKDMEARRTCAGFLNVAVGSGLADDLQIVQLAWRLTGISLDSLRGREYCYRDFDEMLEAHQRGLN